MLDILGGDEVMIYNGHDNPNILSFNMEGLTPGNSYGFSVAALNFNGVGDRSVMSTYTSCTVPSDQSVPLVTGTTSTTISFQWLPPGDTGACPILTYELYIDDGSKGMFVLTDADVIANRAYLR